MQFIEQQNYVQGALNINKKQEIQKYFFYLTANNEAPPSEEALRDQEVKIMELGEQLKGEGKTQEMTDLIQKVRTILKFMSKAKAAKLVCVFPAIKK